MAAPRVQMVTHRLLQTSVAQSASSAGERVAADLGGLRSGAGAGVVFVDAMKQAGPWISSAPLKFDEAGNIVALSKGQSAETVIYAAESYPAGAYTFVYDGSGSFEIAGRVVGHKGGRTIVRIAAQAGGIHLRLLATDPRDYARNMRLILPGFEATYQQQPFHPLFLQAVAPFRVVRFAHWMRGENSFESISTPPNTSIAASQAGPFGVAPDYMIALANATGADPWFTFPMGVTNAYVRQFAERVHERLDPRLRPAFDYDPDAWKAGSPANSYAIVAGGNFKLSADPLTAALDWYSARSQQLFQIVQKSFGHDAGRIVRVLSGPAASTPSNEALDRAILSYAGAAQHADAFAVAGDDGLNKVEGSLASAAAAHVALRRTEVLARGAHLALIFHTGGTSLSLVHPPAADTQLGNSLLRVPATISQFARAPSASLRSASAGSKSALYSGGIHIDAGYSKATSGWIADADYSGGSQTTFYRNAVDTSAVTNPAPQTVYQTGRYSSSAFTYTIPALTPAASYTVRLHFAENYWASAGKRVFNVSITGTSTTLTHYDIFAQAGAAHKAVVAEFDNVTADPSAGTITISFTKVANSAQVNGIEVYPGSGAPTSTPTPAGSPGPAPSPTPAGSPTPTVGSSSTPRPVDLSYSNLNLPPTGWNPLVTNGPSNAPDSSRIDWPAVCASSNPPISCMNGEPLPAANSAAIVTQTFMPGTGGVMGWCSTAGYSLTSGGFPGSSTCQGHDTMSGVFFASNSDPTYTIHCAIYSCGSGIDGDKSDNLEGESVHIADKSIANLGGDGHLSVINEQANLICEFWKVGANPQVALSGGGALSIGQGSCGTLISTWDGVGGIFDAYSSNMEMVRFLVRPEELLAGHIPHALYVSVSNNASGHVHTWPATYADGTCGSATNLGTEGMVYYLSTAGYNRLIASKASALKKTMLRVYHEYGVYDLDTSGCGSPSSNYTNFLGWDPLLWTQTGQANPWETVRTQLASDGNSKDISHNGDYWRMNLDLSDTNLTSADFSVLPLNDAHCVVTGASC